MSFSFFQAKYRSSTAASEACGSRVSPRSPSPARTFHSLSPLPNRLQDQSQQRNECPP